MNDSCSEGEYVEAWCPSCNLKSGHTIIAIADKASKKVKCNTCDEYHDLSAEPSTKSRTKSRSAVHRSKPKGATYEEYLSRLTGGGANPRKYNPKENFKKDEIIEHLKFGIGIVLSVIQINKVEILFKDRHRLLIQNQ